MNEIEVQLGHRSYPIHIGRGLLGESGKLLAPLVADKVFVVTNPTVARHHLPKLLEGLRGIDASTEVILVPDGEQFKTLQTFGDIHTRLLQMGADRKSVLLALGGGVVGDLAGFVAGTYQRGIRCVQVPTTLLAQVDSSVGGKAGVNHALGKNMIGVFNQPAAVLIDLDTLSTLPRREFVAGLAEVIKYGAIRDPAFFAWLESQLEAILALEGRPLFEAILRSCESKAAVVGADENEQGERAILNFGHTFGHAIEAALGYGTWLHGEAVAAGMVMATRLSNELGMVTGVELARLETLVQRAGLPTSVPNLGEATFRRYMLHDKKNARGQLRFVLLESLGHAVVVADPPQEKLSLVLNPH